MYNTKNKTQKVYAKNKPKINIIPDNCVAVFPIEIVSGQTFVSNHGIMPQNRVYDKGSFLFWQEVFDGRKALKIQWKNSIYLEKPLNENYYLANTQIGDYYYGKPISPSSEGVEIGESSSFEDFMSMKTNQTVTLRFEHNPLSRVDLGVILERFFHLKLIDNDLYNLYIIPEISEGKLMHIEGYQEYYDDKTGKAVACEITFASLGDKLQKSGQAVEQYPNWNAPGEFYVKPIIIDYFNTETKKKEKYIDIDPQGLNQQGIKYLQVELQGPALTSAVYALGRRQEFDQLTGKFKIGPSHHLLGYRFITTQPNPLNRTSVPSKNFDFFYDEEVTFATSADLLKLITDGISQPLENVKNGGLITLGVDSEWKDGKPQEGVHLSNDPTNNTQVRYDYYSPNWKPLEHILPSGTTEKSYDTNGCVYAGDTISLTNQDTMIDIINKNAFIFNQTTHIPLSFYATRPFYLRDIPLIGSIANFFKLGDIHLFNNTTNRKIGSLNYFGDADLCGMCANLQSGKLGGDIKKFFSKDGRVAFPINFFGNNETQYNRLGVNAVNTTLCMELTDNIKLDGVDYEEGTLLLGQTNYEDGTYIKGDHTPLLVNTSLKGNQPYEDGYIIDAIVVQSIFDGKIRLSCYTGDTNYVTPLWSTTILSNAAWEKGAMRDWTNMFILSNWTDRYCRQEDDFTWPKAPSKPSQIIKDFQLNWSSNYDSENYRGIGEYIPTHDNTWTYHGRDNWKTVENTEYANRNKNSQTTTINYSDFGIAEVVDRTSFINYFEQVAIEADGSYCKLYDWDRQPESERLVLNPTCNRGFMNTTSLRTGTYNYTFECPVVAINNNDGNRTWVNQNHIQVLDRNSGELMRLDTGTQALSPGVIAEKWGDGSIQAKATVNMVLNESGISITIVDNSQIVAFNCNNKQYGSDTFKWAAVHFAFIQQNWTGNVSYNLKLNKIRFIKRQ